MTTLCSAWLLPVGQQGVGIPRRCKTLWHWMTSAQLASTDSSRHFSQTLHCAERLSVGRLESPSPGQAMPPSSSSSLPRVAAARLA
jgi:hypothetical protein